MPPRRYKSLPSEALGVGFLRMICVYSFGFCLTNGSFGAVNASFVDTVKVTARPWAWLWVNGESPPLPGSLPPVAPVHAPQAAEPIATMLLTLLFLRSESVTPLVGARHDSIVAAHSAPALPRSSRPKRLSVGWAWSVH